MGVAEDDENRNGEQKIDNNLSNRSVNLDLDLG